MEAARPRILIATTNPGKLREFQGAARSLRLAVDSLPSLRTITSPLEDGATFEDNATIKAAYYSRHAPGELVLAEDSGLSVDALGGAPGVHSARYAALLRDGAMAHTNSSDDENNLALVMQLKRLGSGPFAGKYVCVIAAAKDGLLLQTFRGEAHGEILTVPRGDQGFGYDPYFLFPALGKTFAELTLDQKAALSHRGRAFRQFLGWYEQKFPV
jgi:XTP/dITP diphosphohydrolase